MAIHLFAECRALSPRRGRLSGFTLMEMLLVVAILSLLIAMILPNLKYGKGLTNKDKCAASLRMLQMGYQNYSGDNNRLLVGADTGLHPDYDWMGTGNAETSITTGKLWQYVRSMTAYKCPDHVYPWYLNAYGLNGMLNGEQVFDGTTSKRHWTSNMRDSKQLVFIEEDDYRGWNVNSWMLAGTESFIDLPAANHQGGDNLGFLDGHIEFWEWQDKDLRTRPKHGSTGITFGFSDPGNLDWHRLAVVFRSWPKQ